MNYCLRNENNRIQRKWKGNWAAVSGGIWTTLLSPLHTPGKSAKWLSVPKLRRLSHYQLEEAGCSVTFRACGLEVLSCPALLYLSSNRDDYQQKNTISLLI